MYSVEENLKLVQQLKINRAKHMAKTKCNPDFNLKHADETRDGNQNNFTKLIIRVKDEFKAHQLKVQRRSEKLGKRI